MGRMLTASEWHQKHHGAAEGRVRKEDTCLRCMIAKAKCSNKIAYKDKKISEKKALLENISRRWWPDACMKSYRCRYCSKYHLTTAKTASDLAKVDRMYRRWRRKTGQKPIETSFSFKHSA